MSTPMAGIQQWAAVLIGWQKWLPVFIILQLSLGQKSASFFFDFDAEMTPINPILEEGDTLVANCTFKSTYRGPFNASNLFFKHGGERIPDEYVQVLDSRTTQVTLTNMTRNSNTALICFIGENGTITKMQGGLAILVGVPPVKPVITPTDCIVYNWENMTCTWQPEHQQWKNITNLKTNSSLIWTIIQDGKKSEFYECPDQPLADILTRHHRKNECHWKKLDGQNSFKSDMTYYMYVEAQNALGRARSDIVTVHTRHLVLPNPVGDLRMVNRNSTSITLTWKRPSPSLSPVIYRLQYRSQWNDMIMVETTQSIFTLSNLIPNTDYTVQVTVKPAEEGYWSSPSKLTVSSLKDVPKINPAITQGGFVVNSCGMDCRNITIFWQSISEAYWHGDDFHYLVTIEKTCGINQNSREDRNVSSMKTSLSVKANMNCKYLFVVWSENEHGRAPGPDPTPIVVDSQENMPPHGFEIIANALNTTYIDIQWENHSNSETEVMVFWCRGSYLDKECRPPMHWQSVPHKQSWASVMLLGDADYRDYLFGVAWINDEHTGGIHWSECVYDNLSRSPPPNGNVSTYDAPGSLLVQWNSHQDCQKQRGYIISYLIYYCPVCDNKKCCLDSERTVTVPRTTSHYILRGLEYRQEYRVRLKSVTAAGSSEESSDQLYSTTNGHWFHGYKAALTVIGIVVAGVLVLAGIFTVFIKGFKAYSWFGNLPIKPPGAGMGPSGSTSSGMPFSGKDYNDYSPTTDEAWSTIPYTTQQSTESNTDSGHGSISEQNLIQNRRSLSLSEESELDEVFVGDDLKTQNGYLKVTMLDKLTVGDNGYLRPIPSEAVKENGYLKSFGRDGFRPCDARLANCPVLPCVKEESSVSSVSSSDKSQDVGSLENPGYRVVDIIVDKHKSSVA
jgi:hypothetical protein